MTKKSVYEATTSRVEKLNYLGYNYEGKILKRTVSGYLFKDPKRAAILEKFEEVLYFLVEKVKTIKNFYNYTVPKDYKKIN